LSLLNPPLKYHGGKHYLAKKIIALMPQHLHYVEPYFGGGSVLLAKEPEGVSEVANDLNGELVNFWKCIANTACFSNFIRIVEGVPFSEEHYRQAKDLFWPDSIQRAAAFFIQCRQSLAGRMDAFAPLSRTRTRRGMNEQASAWLNAVEGLPAVHARLKRVVILNRPALEVIRSQDGPDTLFYLDPPYVHETRATTGEYLHEMSEADHVELLSNLVDLQGKFILSGYPSKLYDSFFKDFTHSWHDFDLPNNSAGGKDKRRMVERVWCNFSLKEVA
jgi:DNA adenine methylase